MSVDARVAAATLSEADEERAAVGLFPDGGTDQGGAEVQQAARPRPGRGMTPTAWTGEGTLDRRTRTLASGQPRVAITNPTGRLSPPDSSEPVRPVQPASTTSASKQPSRPI